MSDSGVDLIERSLEEDVNGLEEGPVFAPGARPTASLLGFVGVSAGFAVLIALCVGTVITLWFALFGHDLLPPLSVLLGWITQTGIVGVGG